MERLIIRPSVALKYQHHDDNHINIKIYYSSGTKYLEILLKKDCEIYLKDIIAKGISYKTFNKQSNEIPDEFHEFLKLLHERNILISAKHDSALWKEHYERYDRQLRLISEITSEDISPLEVHKSFSRKKIALIGLGGMGTNILQQLAAMGLHNFLLIDPDIVELSNLNRQSLFAPSSVGVRKVDICEKWVKSFNQEAILEKAPFQLDEILTKKILSDYCPDLIINCADVPSIKNTTRSILERLDSPIPILVGGGYFILHTFIGPIIFPGKTACLDCNRNNNEDNPNNLPAIGGNISPVVNIGASIASLNVFKFLTGTKECDLVNKQLIFDLDDISIKERLFKKSNDCSTCSRYTRI